MDAAAAAERAANACWEWERGGEADAVSVSAALLYQAATVAASRPTSPLLIHWRTRRHVGVAWLQQHGCLCWPAQTKAGIASILTSPLSCSAQLLPPNREEITSVLVKIPLSFLYTPRIHRHFFGPASCAGWTNLLSRKNGRGDRIRTCDPLLPKTAHASCFAKLRRGACPRASPARFLCRF